MKFKNRYEAEIAVCAAFARLGHLAGVDVGSGTGPSDLDEDLINACYQSNFGDPHFFGGPCCIVRCDSAEKIERIFSIAFDIAERLVCYISARGSANKVKCARRSYAVIAGVHAWLIRVVKEAIKISHQVTRPDI
jgi:hypothetical protein